MQAVLTERHIQAPLECFFNFKSIVDLRRGLTHLAGHLSVIYEPSIYYHFVGIQFGSVLLIGCRLRSGRAEVLRVHVLSNCLSFIA